MGKKVYRLKATDWFKAVKKFNEKERFLLKSAGLGHLSHISSEKKENVFEERSNFMKAIMNNKSWFTRETLNLAIKKSNLPQEVKEYMLALNDDDLGTVMAFSNPGRRFAAEPKYFFNMEDFELHHALAIDDERDYIYSDPRTITIYFYEGDAQDLMYDVTKKYKETIIHPLGV